MEEVTELQRVPNAHVPVMKFKFQGISIDLLYASISRLVVPEVSSKVSFLKPVLVFLFCFSFTMCLFSEPYFTYFQAYLNILDVSLTFFIISCLCYYDLKDHLMWCWNMFVNRIWTSQMNLCYMMLTSRQFEV